jgi:hypothetical protein
MTVADDLVAARAKIADEAHWIKGVDFSSERLCAMGAVGAALKQPMGGFRWSACEAALIKALPSSARGHASHSVVCFNDRRATTHSDILALFDRAIEAERAKESSI